MTIHPSKNSLFFVICVAICAMISTTLSAQTEYERSQLIVTSKDKITTYLQKQDKKPLSGEIKIIENSRKYIVATFSNGIPNGAYAEYRNGQLVVKATYRLGRKQGVYEEYYPDGKIRQRANYTDGELNGTQTAYFTNGKTERTSLYLNGKKEGQEKLYSPDGKEIATKNYKNDLLHGNLTELSDAGNGTTVHITGNYENGKLHGLSITKVFDAQGKLKYLIENRYEQGELKDRKQVSGDEIPRK